MPVSASVQLNLSQDQRIERVEVHPRSDGRFVCEVELAGECSLYLSENQLGRSLDKAIFLPENRTTELGEFRLYGEGTIEGRVELPDGNPPGDLSVRATSVLANAGPGLRSSQAKLGDEGVFRLTGLAAGEFEFSAFWHADYPFIGPNRLRTGTEDARLILDAVLLRARCLDENGDAVTIEMVTRASLPDEGGDESDYGSTTRTLQPEAKSVDFLCGTGVSYTIRCVDAGGANYFYRLSGDLPAGLHEVDLTRDNPGFGSLHVRAPADGEANDERLSIFEIHRNGHDVWTGPRRSGTSDGHRWVRLEGLLPGAYEIRAGLVDSPWNALVAPTQAFDLAGGENHEITFEVRRGGRIRCTVTLGDAQGANAPRTATVKIQPATAIEWAPTSFRSKSSRATMLGERVWTNGVPATSRPLEPGDYRLRISAPGYLPAEVDAQVTTDSTYPLDVELMPDQ